MFWKNELDVQVVRMSSQFVSLCITEGSNHFLGNFIYAKCNRLERQLLWEELNSDRMGGEPCFFAGDFNVIRSDIERCGGRPRNRVAIDEFNRWIHQGGLLEMNSQGGKFTWCNGQQGLSRAWAKLDRVLLDANFLSLFPTAHCLYLPRTTSDHCPMVIEFLSDPFSYGPPPFRFQQMWVEHPDFMTLVQKVWYESVIGSGLFKLATKLKKLKVALRVWNKSVFGRTNTQIAILEDKIENLENLLQRGWDDDIERELVRTSNELSSWRIREDIRLAQMAKIKWRMGGDRNTKFFHVWLSNKKHRKIHQLRTSNGLEFNSPEAIHLGAVDYFSDFLQRSNPVREVPDLSSLISSVINDEDCVRLCGIPSLVEVKEALSTIPINSSPGPDGFGAGFFMSCWEVVKVDVLEAISEFFLSKRLPRFYSASYIVLIPKVDVPSGFDKFRPISLCSVFYKICSKIIVNRMTGFLPKMISLEQGAFIPGRSIFENISLT